MAPKVELSKILKVLIKIWQYKINLHLSFEDSSHPKSEISNIPIDIIWIWCSS